MDERRKELTKPNVLPGAVEHHLLLNAARDKALDKGAKFGRKDELAQLRQAKNAVTVVTPLERGYECFGCGGGMETATYAETLLKDGSNVGVKPWCLECLIDAEHFGKCVVKQEGAEAAETPGV